MVASGWSSRRRVGLILVHLFLCAKGRVVAVSRGTLFHIVVEKKALDFLLQHQQPGRHSTGLCRR